QVRNAKFVFYDTNRMFVTEANVWNGGAATDPDQNVEFKGNSVIVLRGLTDVSFPKYLITVLNAPEGFTYEPTLDAMCAKLVEAPEAFAQDDYFTMTTTSFAGQKDAEGAELPYFVTEVSRDHFSTGPIEAEVAKPVTVYVERLAAKVSLRVSDALLGTAENGRYKLNVSVAGSPNDTDDTAEDRPAVGATDIYVEFLGWGLNATAKNSFLMKNIDQTWENSEESLGEDWVWNDPAHFRSYWGMSWNYGKDDYPANAGDASAEGDGKNSEGSTYLKYISGSKLGNKIPSADYCMENTNTAQIAANRDALTSVLLKAKICDKDGNGLDMVSYNGILYYRPTYKAYVLGRLDLNAYYIDGTDEDGNTKYTQIGVPYVHLVNAGDGKVCVQLRDELPTDIYSIDKATGAATKITDFSNLNETLASFNEGNPAIGYNGGEMYYNIRIEHLRNNAADDKEVREANYGVVRNHHYVVSVNSLARVGKGIFDPDEVIVPDPDDEGDTYYVGANINVLSWKVVNQDVELE
ncbi:MAG: fimbria major subunit, partial [Alistipes sp.]|nr:fimbria major subunit [Alistipes sp.]